MRHATDVALQTFPVVAAARDGDAGRVRISTSEAGMGALVRAVNRGVAAVAADNMAALAATARRVPTMHEAAERVRLEHTLTGDMGHSEGARLGLGAIDPARFGRAIAALCGAKRLARIPRADEVFDSSFLPPAGDRITTLAARG